MNVQFENMPDGRVSATVKLEGGLKVQAVSGNRWTAANKLVNQVGALIPGYPTGLLWDQINDGHSPR